MICRTEKWLCATFLIPAAGDRPRCPVFSSLAPVPDGTFPADIGCPNPHSCRLAWVAIRAGSEKRPYPSVRPIERFAKGFECILSKRSFRARLQSGKAQVMVGGLVFARRSANRSR